jgi:hypothetical protein
MYFRELIQGYSMETCAGNTEAYTNGYTVIRYLKHILRVIPIRSR